MKRAGEDGWSAPNGPIVEGPGQMPEPGGNGSPLSAAAVHLSRPGYRR